MEIIIYVINDIFILFAFLIGVNVRQKVDKGEKVTTNIIKTIQESNKSEKQQNEHDEEYLKIIEHNINVYDGSDIGQIDVPRKD